MVLRIVDENYWLKSGDDIHFEQPKYSDELSGTNIEIPAWWASAIQRIGMLLALPDNWDSYGARKINKQTAYFAVQILQQISDPAIPEPSIVPTIRGNLQFEWHIYGIDLEFEVLSPVAIEVSFEDTVTGNEWEDELDYNLTPLTDILKTLLVRAEEYIAA